MKKVALHEVATINPRASQLSLLPTDPVSFVPMAAVSERSRNIEEVEVRQYSEVSKGYTYFEEGDVIVAKITPCYENGKIALARDLPHRVAFGSTEFHVFRASDAIDNRYIFHLLQAPAVRIAGASQMKGAAGQKRVPAEYFKSLQIPVPPLTEQKRIAAILDAADALRAKRRESLAQLDTLLQSTFLDMFGDPVTNPKGWKMGQLSDVVERLDGGKNVAQSETETAYRVLKVSAVTSGVYRPEESKYLPDDFKVQESYLVRKGDLLISRANTVELIGATAYVWETPVNMVLPDKIWKFIWKKDAQIKPLFIYYVTQDPEFRRILGSRASGTSGSMKNIAKPKLLSLPIPIPPSEIQSRFATIVESVEQQKARLRQHQAELDTLFASLQQRAFAGDL